MKKAAMFGLDARIALAIFGALSVISGAALYSAIQNSQATSILTEMNEVGKAWEQYLLDTGSDLPADATYSYLRNVNELVSSSKNGWNGPYLSNNAGAATNKLAHNKYNYIQLIAATGDTFGASGTWYQSHNCGVSDVCYNWVLFREIPNLGLVQRLDEMVDGTSGADVGRLRYFIANDGEDYRTMYQYAAYPKP